MGPLLRDVDRHDELRAHVAEHLLILSNFDDEADALEEHLALRPRPVDADAEA